ncbi:hypothetical protein CIK05_01120 [Bdellovibrio sp. qaytius]|nr:hypothetical protein CIK05_01120 [Bdellovibrio sp. qaytius]
MEEKDFEGTLVLEKIAEINKLDEFMEAVDNDDFRHARELMRKAGVDPATMSVVLKKMHAAD